MNYEKLQQLRDELGKVLVGQTEMVDGLLCGLLVGGHVLLEGLPGLGKTLAVKALAQAIGGSFSRIQFTPDLLPGDITGVQTYRPETNQYEVRLGPLNANLVLADEINRAPAKVQSALLEAMQERQVSIGGKTIALPDPFFVVATQNPIEQGGTYPLPEAQKDRFMLTVSIGYPSVEDEIKIITGQKTMQHPVDLIQPVAEKQDVVECMEQVLSVHVDEAVLSYLISLSAVTRQDERIAAGVSPRGSIALYKAGQAYAALNGRNFVTPEDIKLLAEPVFRKRLILKSDAILKGYTEESIIKELLQTVPVPAFRAHV